MKPAFKVILFPGHTDSLSANRQTADHKYQKKHEN